MAGFFGGVANFIGSDEELYGTKPEVPEAADYASQLQKFINSNINMLPSLQSLASLSTEALTRLMEQTLPGYGTLRDTTTDTLTSWGRGELTPEMDADIQRRAAEQGITLGTTDSKFSTHRGLKLGLDTRIGLQERSLNSAASWIAGAQGRTFDFTKMFLGPQEAIQQAESTWQRDWLAAQVAAAPDPAARGALETELAVLGISAGIYGGSGAAGGRSYTPSYGNTGGRTPYGGGGGSYFGTSGGGAPSGDSFSNYYSSGVNPYSSSISEGGYNPGGLSPYNY